jgi:hypothetical protein
MQATNLVVSPDYELTGSRALLLQGLRYEASSVSKFGESEPLTRVVKVQVLAGRANVSAEVRSRSLP